MSTGKEQHPTERPSADVSDTRELGPVPSGLRPPPDPATLERLLTLANDLPIDEGSDAVVRLWLDRVAELLPELALGVCIVDSSRGEQLVDMRLPDGVEPGAGHDPSRVFPGLAHEHVVRLAESLTGSTFHVGTPTAPAPAPGVLAVLDRAVPLLEHALRRARALERKGQSVAALEHLQAQIIQTEKLASLGQIVAGVVHELNNPLTSIVAYADYLKRRLESRDDSTDDVERARRIGEAAQRILRFSRDLVAYARPSSDVPGPVMLHEVIDKALVFCEHELEKSGVQVERRWQAEIPMVLGISGQLTQVFVNLFTNASHAMSGSGGTLTVTTCISPTPERVTVTVDDDGSGIEPDHVRRVFEPFFTTKTEGRGTGLGLSIVHDIVTAHGGSVSVTSSVGEGTTFTLELPVAIRRSSTRPPPAE